METRGEYRVEQPLYPTDNRKQVLHSAYFQHVASTAEAMIMAGWIRYLPTERNIENKVSLDNYLRPSWRESEIDFVSFLINLRNYGLIDILKTYSFSDHEMIIYPFEYYEKNNDKTH